MTADTWNYPTWQSRDKGPGSTRADAGAGFVYGTGNPTLPFTNSMTGIFSFFLRQNFVADSNELQFLTSIGHQSASVAAALQIALRVNDPGDSKLTIAFYDEVNSLYRYNYTIGDEDGTSWLKFGKFYEVVFAADTTGFRYAINGSVSSKVTVVAHVPGALNMREGTERWWHLSPTAAYAVATPVSVLEHWPSFIVGPSAWHTGTLDLTDQNVLDQIFDSNGDLKNPGQNGKLWWGADGLTSPLFYFVDGGLRFQQGTDSVAWRGQANNSTSCPGGMKKEYEASP